MVSTDRGTGSGAEYPERRTEHTRAELIGPLAAYVQAFNEQCRPEVPISSLVGRVLRGTQELHFERLTADFDRRLALVTGADALHDFIGLSGREILAAIGYSASDVAFYQAAGAEFRLMVCAEAETFKGVAATWRNVLQAAEQAYPELVGLLVPHEAELQSRAFAEFSRAAGDIAARFMLGPNSPAFMTVARFLESDQSAASARAFLYHTLGLRELFAGDGYTRFPDGRRGISEYLVPNVPLKDVGTHAFIRLGLL